MSGALAWNEQPASNNIYPVFYVIDRKDSDLCDEFDSRAAGQSVWQFSANERDPLDEQQRSVFLFPMLEANEGGGTENTAFAQMQQNKLFLHRMLHTEPDLQYLRTLFPNDPKTVFAFVVCVEGQAALSLSAAELLQSMDQCITTCGQPGQVVLAEEKMLLLLIDEASGVNMDMYFRKYAAALKKWHGIKIALYAQGNYRVNASLGKELKYLLDTVSAYRYYKKPVSAEEVRDISQKKLQDVLKEIENWCATCRYENAVNVLHEFVREAHASCCSPASVKSNVMRLMYVFYGQKEKSGEDKMSYMLSFITEQMLNVCSARELEQVVEDFSSYLLENADTTDQMLPEVIVETLSYIKANYQRPIRLNEVADAVHLNKSYLSQLFQKKMGVTYSQYLESIRIQEAKKLLKRTNKTASEIAEEVGFSGQNYFAKIFKSSVGMSPIKYRNCKEMV